MVKEIEMTDNEDKEMKIESGTVIRLSPDQTEVLNTMHKNSEDLMLILSVIAQSLSSSRDDVLKYVREVIPELEDWEFTVVYKKGQIHVLFPRDKRTEK